MPPPSGWEMPQCSEGNNWNYPPGNGAGVLGGEGNHEQEAIEVCSVLLVRVLQTGGQGRSLGGRGVSGLPGGGMRPPVSLFPPKAVAGDVTRACCSRSQLSQGLGWPLGLPLPQVSEKVTSLV